MKKRRVNTPPQSQPNWDRKKFLYLFLVVFLFAYLAGKLIIDLSQSLFFRRPARVNVVVYGQYPVFYSLGGSEVGNYAIELYPDIKTYIPGGYGLYRIGALGKLARLEKDTTLYQKTFSSITSTFVDYYFSPNSDEVHYGGPREVKRIAKPSLNEILFMQSNASFLDRIYISLRMNQIQPSSLYDISYLPIKRLKDDTIFRNDNFLEKYIGLFYVKAYRKENLNVQIHYTSQDEYPTADMISNMLNGNGIVVGDITRMPKTPKQCRIIENTKTMSQTARKLTDFFACGYQTGDTDVYDILFILGSLEDSWSIK